MLNINELAGFGVGGSDPIKAGYLTTLISTANGSAYNFPGVALGEAGYGRKIGILVWGTDGSTGVPNGVTVGGVAATPVVVSTPIAGSSDPRLGGFVIDDWTNTAADIGVTFSGSKGRCGIGVYSVLNADDVVIGDWVVGGGNNSSLYLPVPDGGVVMAAAAGWNNQTATWLGVDEDWDQIGEGQNIFTGGHRQIETGAPDHQVRVTFSGSLNHTLVGMVFKPRA